MATYTDCITTTTSSSTSSVIVACCTRHCCSPTCKRRRFDVVSLVHAKHHNKSNIEIKIQIRYLTFAKIKTWISKPTHRHHPCIRHRVGLCCCKQSKARQHQAPKTTLYNTVGCERERYSAVQYNGISRIVAACTGNVGSAQQHSCSSRW